MKYYNFLIILIMVCSFLQAQDQPIAFNPNMLAHSQGLPNDFLIFSPDTSVQILFNPARAMLSNRRFVYTNYIPYSSTPISILQASSLFNSYYYGRYYSAPTLSAAALFDAAGSTWLFQFSNWVYRYTNDQTSVVYDGSSISSTSVTSAKLSLIGNLNDSPYSIGVFGILYPNNSTSNYNQTNEHHYGEYLLYESHGLDYSRRELESANSKYMAGIEFSLTGASWDFIAQLSIQKNKVEGSSASSSDGSGYNWYPFDTVNYINSSNQVISLGTTEPLIYAFHGYFQHKANMITLNEYFFISPTIYYSDGRLFYNRWSQYNSWQQHSDTTGVHSATYSSTDESRWNLQTINWGAAFSFGYVAVRNSEDIDLMVGLNPRFSYDHFTYMPDAYYLDSDIIEHKVWSAGLTIPIYLNFKPTSWCSIFGGLNFQYNYSYDMSDDSEPYFSSTSSSSKTQLRSRKISSLNSTSNSYAGMELRHPSGLHMQVAFNGSVSDYRAWNISLGYVY